MSRKFGPGQKHDEHPGAGQRHERQIYPHRGGNALAPLEAQVHRPDMPQKGRQGHGAHLPGRKPKPSQKGWQRPLGHIQQKGDYPGRGAADPGHVGCPYVAGSPISRVLSSGEARNQKPKRDCSQKISADYPNHPHDNEIILPKNDRQRAGTNLTCYLPLLRQRHKNIGGLPGQSPWGMLKNQGRTHANLRHRRPGRRNRSRGHQKAQGSIRRIHDGSGAGHQCGGHRPDDEGRRQPRGHRGKRHRGLLGQGRRNRGAHQHRPGGRHDGRGDWPHGRRGGIVAGAQVFAASNPGKCGGGGRKTRTAAPPG